MPLAGLMKHRKARDRRRSTAHGYLLTPTYSTHWIADSGISSAVEEFPERERRGMQRETATLADYRPFNDG